MTDDPRATARDGAIDARAAALFDADLDGVHRQTDRLFALLLPLQWTAAVVVAVLASPRSLLGDVGRAQDHFWISLALGGVIVALPTGLAVASPGQAATRQAIAAGQMLIGALLIFLCGGRLETHFHIFGSLALLAFYRDWKVLTTASAVAAVSHLLRRLCWPESIDGSFATTHWRAAEHAAWVGLIDVFLIRSCVQATREMRKVAGRQAALEATRAGIEETVRLRTAELTERTEQLHRTAVRLEERDARLSAAAEFSAALNHSEAPATYQAAIRCLAGVLRSPCVALFTVGTEGRPPEARAAFTLDGATLNAAEFAGDGLPAEVARSGEPRTIRGPFPAGSLRSRAGLAEVELGSVAGWPAAFQGRCVGVLVTAHVTEPTDEQAAFVTASLGQLAVRMNAFAVEEQRARLVADLREQSRALEEARAEAERANRVKSEFLASMSHELRTPMNSILGFTARLIRKLGGTLPERELGALHTVDRNARHLLELINDILDLSKIEAGRMELHRERLDFAAVVREAFDQSAVLADGRPVELIFEGPTTPLTLQGDRTKLRQVTTNLISNAIKYTERGVVRVQVDEAIDPRLGRVARLAVRDTGIGIRQADRSRLFTKFTQLNGGTTRAAGGTGLGLVISDQFVRMHGGRIEVDSEFGLGSEFAALLPLDTAPADAPHDDADDDAPGWPESDPTIRGRRRRPAEAYP